MSTVVLERPAKPCGCGPAAASTLGQKVKIMAGVGSSGAGGQTVHIQPGTGKSSVGRQSQTIHIRGEAVTCVCGITDTFTRVVAGGSGAAGDWGISDAGIPWTGAGGAGSASVNGTQGILEVTNAFETIDLAFDMDIPWCRVLITLTGAVSATGDGWNIQINKEAGAFASVLLFGDGTLKLFTDAGGNDTASVADPTVPLWVMVETDGTDALVKVWADGDPEPTIPTLSHPFNSPGFAWFTDDLQVSAFSNSAAVTVAVDEVMLGSCLYDDFERDSEPVDWGMSHPTGQTYTYPGSIPIGATLSTNGSYGIVNIEPDTPTVNIRLPAYPMWAGADGFIASFEFSTGEIPGTGDAIRIAFFHGEGAEPPMNLEIDISSDPDYGLVLVYDTVLLDQIVKTDWVEFTDYRAKIERRPLDGILRAKVWAIADGEPDWQVVTTTSNADPLESFMQFAIDNLTDASYALYFNDIAFDKCPYVPPG